MQCFTTRGQIQMGGCVDHNRRGLYIRE